MNIYVARTEQGCDGEWDILGIYSTQEQADAAVAHYMRPRYRPDGSSYIFRAEVQEWEVEERFEPSPINS